MSENIRYYKGVYKLERLSDGDVSKKALYRALEDGPTWVKDDLVITPYRICHRKRLIKYKCRKCGIYHIRGKIFRDHFKYQAGHKQIRRGPYKKAEG